MKNNILLFLILSPAIFFLMLKETFPQQIRITQGATCKTTGAASIILNNVDFENHGTFTATGGTTVTFKGALPLTIGGSVPSSFDNLAIDNSNGITITNSETVNGTLTFINGKITLGGNDLILNESASISGCGSSGYVITNGVGSLRQRVINDAIDVTYPVGLASDYLPVLIQLTAGSTADDISVRVANGLYTAYDENGVPAGSLVSSSVVDKTWFIEESVQGESNASLKFQWNSANETPGFNHSVCDAGSYSENIWNYSTVSAADGTGPFTQNIDGIVSFSPFGIWSPYITSSVSTGPYCAGSPLPVAYSVAGGIWNAGNIFRAQLSDASGSFEFPLEIGAIESLSTGIINSTIASGSSDGVAYRVRVTSSNPSVTGQDNGADITINQLRNINGSLTYYNLANTPLTSDIKVQLFQEGGQVGSDYQVTDGSFTFNDLCPGDYELRITSTKSTSGSINTTDAAQVNFWGANPYTIEKVRFYAGDVTGEQFFLNSSDAQLIKARFVYNTPFTKGGPWTFWRAGQTISSNSNPPESYPIVSLIAGSNANALIYGLCTGDFNRSFSASYKTEDTQLALVQEGTVYAGPDTELELPVSVMQATGIGAVSLILNFPGEFAEIRNVRTAISGDDMDWSVSGNELRIGWFSQNPLYLDGNEELLSITLKTASDFTTGNVIRFTVEEDPANELADQNFETVPNALLSIPQIKSSSTGLQEGYDANGLLLSNRPNPFYGYTSFRYAIPGDGRVTIEICNMMGNIVELLVNEYQQKGQYTQTYNPPNLAPGIYIATLRFSSDKESFNHTIKIVKAW